MSIKQKILKEAFHEISHDTKFIRLATITTFIHSLFFVLYISYRVSVVLAKYQGGDNKLIHTVLSYIHIGNSGIDITFLIIIGVLLLIGFFILPPIGEGAMIFYLDNPKKQGSVSLGKGLSTFLQMFELDGALYAFNILTFLIALFRVYVMGILGNGFIIALMSIRFFIILSAAFLLPYTKLFITLEKKKFFDAMRASMNFSTEHFGITFKFIIVDFLLHIRFVVNIIIVFGIPLLLMYLGNKMGITANPLVRTIFALIIVLLFLLTAYINGIIEAFFATYRYKVYKHIKNTENPEKEEDVVVAQQPLQQHVQYPQNVTINQYVTPPHPGVHPGYQQHQQRGAYQQQPAFPSQYAHAQYTTTPQQALPNQQTETHSPNQKSSPRLGPSPYQATPLYQQQYQQSPSQNTPPPGYGANQPSQQAGHFQNTQQSPGIQQTGHPAPGYGQSYGQNQGYTQNPQGYPPSYQQQVPQQYPQGQNQYQHQQTPQGHHNMHHTHAQNAQFSPQQYPPSQQGYQTPPSSPSPYPPQQTLSPAGYYDENGVWIVIEERM